MWKRKLNPNAKSESIISVAASESGCCGEDGTECKYSIVTDYANPVLGITVSGEYVAFSMAATDDATLATGVNEVLEGLGYADMKSDSYSVGTMPNGGGVDVFGEAKIESYNDGADTAVMESCDKATLCNYKGGLSGAATLTINGAIILDGATNYGTAGQAAAMQAAAEAGLTAAGITATVSVMEITGGYWIAINGASDLQTSLERCDCMGAFA